jgi:type IV pilus assembly protein PilV
MSRKTLSIRNLSRTRGMTLVEVLVSLVVLSVGLLGIAALQMTSLRNNLGAHLRSQATVLAYDVTDRMRANRTQATAGAYDVALGANLTGTTINAIDVQAWKTALAATLPGGDGAIARVGNVFRITITWTEQGGLAQTFTTHTQI